MNYYERNKWNAQLSILESQEDIDVRRVYYFKSLNKLTVRETMEMNNLEKRINNK